jgi:hypothetical protein
MYYNRKRSLCSALHTMADRLTQLQDAIDQVTTQFFSALRYVGTHHDAIPVGNEAKVTDENAVIDNPETFEGSSRCLVLSASL